MVAPSRIGPNLIEGIWTGDPDAYPIGLNPEGITGTSSLGVAANDGNAYEVRPARAPRTLTVVRFQVTVSSGNLDWGLYDAVTGERLGSTGSFACPATGHRSQALSAPVNLEVGQRVCVAHSADNATLRLASTNTLNAPFYGALGTHSLRGGYASNMFPLPATLPALNVTPTRMAVGLFA